MLSLSLPQRHPYCHALQLHTADGAVAPAGKFSGKMDPMTRLEYAAAVPGSHGAAARDQCLGWVDRPLFSHEGASLVFAYHVDRCKGSTHGKPPSSYLFTVGADGSGLWRCACASHDRHISGAGPLCRRR